MIYDVIIIGAGITGIMTARALSKYKLKTALIEAENDVASGATAPIRRLYTQDPLCTPSARS